MGWWGVGAIGSALPTRPARGPYPRRPVPPGGRTHADPSRRGAVPMTLVIIRFPPCVSSSYVAAGRVAWQEGPAPRPSDPGGAIVRPLAVARCDLDPIMAGFGIFPGPFAVGHETVAEIVAVGDERARTAGRRAGARAVPGVVRRLRGVPRRALRRVPDLSRQGGRGVRLRRGGRRARRRGRRPARRAGTPTTCSSRRPGAVAPPRCARCRTTSPTATAPSRRSLRAQPGAEVLVVGGAAASIGLYAVAAAVALRRRPRPLRRHRRRSLRRRDRARRRRHAPRRRLAAALRARADHRREHRRRRRARMCAALDRRLRHVHERRDPLRADDADAAARAVHEGHHATTCRAPTRAASCRRSSRSPRAARSTRSPCRRRSLPWDQADEAWLAPATKLVLERA